jgi:hypothetical protein
MGGKSKKGPSSAEKAQVAQQNAEVARLRAENEAMARSSGESLAAMMRSRRVGRALLSDARLNPEQGVATLGESPTV